MKPQNIAPILWAIGALIGNSISNMGMPTSTGWTLAFGFAFGGYLMLWTLCKHSA